MTESVKILDYTGNVDHSKVDFLLEKVKNRQEFKNLNKTTAKRVYAILVECLENIVRHSGKGAENIKQPYISATNDSARIIIRSGNTVTDQERDKLAKRLDLINQLDGEALHEFYENEISSEPRQDFNGAGLGFMVMKLKSGNNIDYNFTNINGHISYFELQISVNKHVMRRLIKKQTVSSPKVIFDPDKNQFEISGESRPPDVTDFYREILGWTDDFSRYLTSSKQYEKPVVFNLDFEYFNSSSAKFLLDFCKQLAGIRSNGHNINVKWHYEEDDADMLAAGKELARMAKMPFEFTRKEPE